MNTGKILSDQDHPDVQAKAAELTSDKSSDLDKLKSIFHFVRDGIQFGFPQKWDEVKANKAKTPLWNLLSGKC